MTSLQSDWRRSVSLDSPGPVFGSESGSGISAVRGEVLRLQNNPIMNLEVLDILLLLNCQLVYLGVRRLGKNDNIALPGFYCMSRSLWLLVSLIPVSRGIISEFQKYLKKLKALKIPYEFDEIEFDTDQTLPEPQTQVYTGSAHSY